jgi:FAD/FMN-containing dehydrogenase
MTREGVLGLEVVMADGTVLPAMNRLIKNNSGFDLKHLFIGAEGTLGVITRLVLRLREKPSRQDVALVAVPSFDAIVGLLKQMDRRLGGALSAFEVMWPEFYELVTTPPARGRAPLPHGAAFYVLVEALGAGEGMFGGALEAVLAEGLVADAAIAHSQADVAAIWGLRDDVLQTGRHGPPMAFDVSLRVAAMPGYVAQVRAGLARRFAPAHLWVFGHLGDGNLHLVISSNGLPTDAREAIEQIIYAPLQAAGGAISAEHGIGLEKKRWLHLSRSAEEIALMRTLKSALDPKGILNPGRVV